MKFHYRTCVHCGKRWNVSSRCWPDSSEYICPVCAHAAAKLLASKA